MFFINGTLYFFVKEFLKKNFFPTEKIGFYKINFENSIDIDKKEDLLAVHKLIN